MKNVYFVFIALILWSCHKDSDDDKSAQKQIKTFTIAGATQTLIKETDKTISVDVPFGMDITALSPGITISDKAMVSPASGVSRNFSQPQVYTVTAEDGSKAEYTVTVTVATFDIAITGINKSTVEIGEELIISGTFADSDNRIELKRTGTEESIPVQPAEESSTSLSFVVGSPITEGTYTLVVKANGAETAYQQPITVIARGLQPKILSVDKTGYIPGVDEIVITGENFPDEDAIIYLTPLENGGSTRYYHYVEIKGNKAILMIPDTYAPGDYKISIEFDSHKSTNDFTVRFIENTFSGPEIVQISKSNICVGEEVIITGRNFYKPRVILNEHEAVIIKYTSTQITVKFLYSNIWGDDKLIVESYGKRTVSNSKTVVSECL